MMKDTPQNNETWLACERWKRDNEGKYPLLAMLSMSNVFEVGVANDQLSITEMCDEYFSVWLTKRELAKLIEELQQIHDTLG